MVSHHFCFPSFCYPDCRMHFICFKVRISIKEIIQIFVPSSFFCVSMTPYGPPPEVSSEAWSALNMCCAFRPYSFWETPMELFIYGICITRTHRTHSLCSHGCTPNPSMCPPSAVRFGVLTAKEHHPSMTSYLSPFASFRRRSAVLISSYFLFIIYYFIVDYALIIDH